MTRREDEQLEAEVDEYLWPLTGDLTSINWQSLSEELQIRERLAEIASHVREMHVSPRLRRLGPRLPSTAAQVVAQAVVAGPENGPPWEQRLKEPVPRRLRDEWAELVQRLRDLEQRRCRPTVAER